MEPSVSVILLAHNEADTIQDEVRAFFDVVVKNVPGAELVIAEDGSSDGTRARIEEIAASLPLRLTGGAERLGYTRAVEGALRSSAAEWVFLCDSGLKHEPRDFFSLWDARHPFDLIVGRKTDRRDQLYRRLMTVGFNVFVRTLFGYPVHDCDSGMRLLRRPVVDAVLSRGLTFRGFSSSEVVVRSIAAGFRYAEMPVSYRARAGESRGIPTAKLPKIIARGVLDLLRLRRELRAS